MVPPVFLAQAVQHFNRVVCSEFLSHEAEVRGRHGVGQQIVQSASNAINRTVLRFRQSDAPSKGSAQTLVVGALDNEQVPSKPSQARVHIDRQHFLCGGQAFA